MYLVLVAWVASVILWNMALNVSAGAGGGGDREKWNTSQVAAIVMVKNEEKALPRLLDSLKGVVSYVFVCDTGSTDETKQVFFQHAMAGEFRYIGEFHDFETSRNLCMNAARLRLSTDKEWILLPDADFTLQANSQLSQPEYDINIVRIETGGAALQNHLPLLVRARAFFGQCRYRLWTHEILDCCTSANLTTGYYNDVSFVDHADGGNRPGRLERDIRLLEEWLQHYDQMRNQFDWRPDFWARALYYLGRAYEDNGDSEKAYTTYREHNAVQPWTNYQFYGRYRMAQLKLREFRHRNDSRAWRAVEEAFVDAIQSPFGDGLWRREPYYHLVWFHCELAHWARCWAWAQAALATPPIDYSRMPLFLEPVLYDEAWFRAMAAAALGNLKN